MKKWLLYTLSAVVSSLFTLALFNYFMDPLWTFEHQHPYNQYQRGSKERQQKSHYLYFRSHQFNTLILGSSRTTFMDQALWYEEGSTFNYAVSDMQPEEYKAYIDFAIHKANQPIRRVVIGLDFFGALEYAPFVSAQSQEILSPVTQNGYRWKLLLSFDALDYSIKNISYYLKKRPNTYNRNNQKHCFPSENLTLGEYKSRIVNDLEEYKKNRYITAYNQNYKEILLDLISAYPDIEFIVYTTPVSLDHFKLLTETDQYKNYERWLKESVEVFRTIHHFMYLNAYTEDSKTSFVDSNHPQQNTAECLANQIQGIQNNCQSTDYILTKKEISMQLQTLRQINRL